jgi:serine/threonine protein kinase
MGPGRSLVEIEDEHERSREIVRIVDDICVAVKASARKQDSKLLTVKAILGEEAFKRHISVESVISDKGDFADVCRGRDGSQRDVAIKVMRLSPVEGILDKLEKAAKRRQDLHDPGFIRLYDSFRVNSTDGEHLVLVMEYFKGETLRKTLDVGLLKGRFVDSTVTLVRRAAEALKELHAVESAAAGKRGEIAEIPFGPMIPEHLYYDPRLGRVRFPALSISNFMWDALGWKKFSFYDSSLERYTAPEQIAIEGSAAAIDKRKIDQYMLGQLTVEMLDGRLPLGEASPKDVLDQKAESFDQPLRYAGSWKNTHPQLERLVAKMLARNQQERWAGMEEIVMALKAVEPNRRALAKASYMKWIDTDAGFFEEFYKSFFASKVAKRERSALKFTDRKQQHDKLRKGMAAVLNFYPGNEPTSLRYVIDMHRHKGVSEDELVEFEKTFLRLLKERFDTRLARTDEMVHHRAEIIEAWRELFGQVLDYFRKHAIDG